MYRVCSKKHDGYVVNQSHILSLKHVSTGKVNDICVMDYLENPDQMEDWLGYRVKVDFQELSSVPTNEDAYQFAVQSNPLQTTHIPHLYKTGSSESRSHYMMGLLNSISVSLATSYRISTIHASFAEDIVFVARSLGMVAYWTHQNKYCDVRISTDAETKNTQTYRITLEPLGEDDYYGFEIDGNRRFVLGDFTVTHNTIMSLNIIHRMCKKTIILVHKEFLMNQWIDRIRDFLPSARVGIIQGTKHDIENKDIVIAMIQTIYNRDYKLHAFSSFGLTIIDEVHRIGSEEFSKTLTKIVTPNMLGISATVDRKDGLTDILYMFIGPKIYHEERKDEDVVQVRGIQYEDPHDIDYNTVEYDFRGNVKFSTMITKISDHLPRCRFLVRIIKDLLEENDQNQIMVLSHTRNLLTYLHDEINTQQIGSCGYYVGGMKQVALQETEEKQIVLATYAMAAEALDIKTLNTLVMVSPKTDIVQSVGRILRTRGNGKIVVDVIDAHDLFQNQWKKRKTFYHKSNYQVRCISSLVYSGMRIDWENDTSWKLITGRRGKSAATTKTTKTKKGSQTEFEDDEEDAPVKCMIDLSQFTEENVV